MAVEHRPHNVQRPSLDFIENIPDINADDADGHQDQPAQKIRGYDLAGPAGGHIAGYQISDHLIGQKRKRQKGKEEAALIAAATQGRSLREYTIIVLMLHTGLREMEVCNLRPEDLQEAVEKIKWE